jgi:hypothetical protein
VSKSPNRGSEGAPKILERMAVCFEIVKCLSGTRIFRSEICAGMPDVANGIFPDELPND